MGLNIKIISAFVALTLIVVILLVFGGQNATDPKANPSFPTTDTSPVAKGANILVSKPASTQTRFVITLTEKLKQFGNLFRSQDQTKSTTEIGNHDQHLDIALETDELTTNPNSTNQ